MHRESVISVASFDSLPEQGEALVSPAMRSGLNAHGHGYIAPRRHAPGKGRIESPRRRTRRDVHIHADDIREAKRKKVIEEFYETERTYVDGLELIYSVRWNCDSCTGFFCANDWVDGSISSHQSLYH